MATWKPDESSQFAARLARSERRRFAKEARKWFEEVRPTDPHNLLFHNRTPPRRRAVDRFLTGTEEGRQLIREFEKLQSSSAPNGISIDDTNAK
jgi:hypothetical protein